MNNNLFSEELYNRLRGMTATQREELMDALAEDKASVEAQQAAAQAEQEQEISNLAYRLDSMTKNRSGLRGEADFYAQEQAEKLLAERIKAAQAPKTQAPDLEAERARQAKVASLESEIRGLQARHIRDTGQARRLEAALAELAGLLRG